MVSAGKCGEITNAADVVCDSVECWCWRDWELTSEGIVQVSSKAYFQTKKAYILRKQAESSLIQRKVAWYCTLHRQGRCSTEKSNQSVNQSGHEKLGEFEGFTYFESICELIVKFDCFRHCKVVQFMSEHYRPGLYKLRIESTLKQTSRTKILKTHVGKWSIYRIVHEALVIPIHSIGRNSSLPGLPVEWIVLP